MPPLLTNHSAIEVVEVLYNTTEYTGMEQEQAAQTFLLGAPVQMNVGYVREWDGTTVANGLLGFSLEDAHNLVSNGFGAPGPFTPVGFPGTGITFGSVPNEPNAVNIPLGAPFSLGMINFAYADSGTVFRGQTDNNTGIATTPVRSNIGTLYGLTKDTFGHWYVDFGKVTVGTNTVVEMIDLDPIDGSVANARILFRVVRTAQFLQ